MEPGPGFGVAALDEWIGDRLPGRGAPLQATRMGQGTGEANALYWLRRGRHVWDIEVREGLPTRAELAARYAERTGADLSALPYYQALALFKLAIILEGSVARRRAATAPGTGAPDTASREAMVDRLIRYAGLFARGQRSGERSAPAARSGGLR